MKNTKKTIKTIVFSLGLAVLTLTATNLNAQNKGLFGKGGSAAEKEPMGGMMRGSIDDNTGTGMTNQTFGESSAPLGSGLLVLIGAGLGYVALKKKED